MDSDSLQADLNSLRKLYGLLQINGPHEQSALSETLDEDSRVLLRKLLDEAAERAFKAQIKAMADNWRSLVPTPNLLQLEESKKSNSIQSSVPSFAAKSPSFNQNINEELKHLETKQEEKPKMPNLPPTTTPRLRRSATDILSRKKPSMEHSFEKETQSPGAEFSKRKVDKKGSNVQEFSKEVDDAIRRIESLIPSLHRLAKPVVQSSAKNEASNLNSAFGSSGGLDDIVTTSDQGSQRIGNHFKRATTPYYTQQWSDHSGEYEGKLDRIGGLSGLNMIPDSKNWETRMLPGQINEYNGYQGQIQSQRTSMGNYVHRGNNYVQPRLDESSESRSDGPDSSGWTTVGSSSYNSPGDSFVTGTSYDSENDETGLSDLRSDYKDVEYGSSEAEFEPSQSGSYYSGSSSHRPDYEGDVSQSEYYRTDRRNARRRRQIGGFGRLKNKLGLIFHHHHHHHHHDSAAPGQGQFWNNLGKKFRGAEKDKSEALNVDAKGKQLARSGSRKEQIGHFHALVEGLMRHVRRPSESGGAGNLERRRLGPSKAAKRLHWWQNIGGRRGKARLKLRGGKRRPQLKGAKRLLRYS